MEAFGVHISLLATANNRVAVCLFCCKFSTGCDTWRYCGWFASNQINELPLKKTRSCDNNDPSAAHEQHLFDSWLCCALLGERRSRGRKRTRRPTCSGSWMHFIVRYCRRQGSTFGGMCTFDWTANDNTFHSLGEVDSACPCCFPPSKPATN